ncbi:MULTISPECIES: TetR/AcrR family transcriptional regulator [Desulfitobacterium]|uniref:Transcriptional regulator n=1 Tax=Desulfitobacterium dehalogenans (strain ATCC 51507 / DSM 9161 / JW/IU-DC1) TaxID=756499 RepID=I4AAN1_DESDJ|nr:MULTISPECIES: TetR/AcrR family transcriptional regulator [Desulfitobacterium]AFM01016.1 transcriptional regulator [Desulfitobacterium dehalogenans ATCC 51507]
MRERILEKAYELIQRYGLRGFTMDDVAGELGISKKTIYKFFDSKHQLISQLVDSIIEVEKRTFKEAMSRHSTWQEKFEAMLTVYTPEDIPFRLVDELYRYYPKEKVKIEKMAEFRREIFYPLIQEGQAMGKIRLDFNPDIIVSMIHNLFMTPADSKLLESQDITVKQLFEQMKNLFFYGILNHGEDKDNE